jgi:hypothetical protein
LKRLLSALLAVSLVMVCAGCGNIFVRGSFQPGASSVSGFVSIVQLSTVIGENGTTLQVTFVSFLQNGTSSTIAFCGDQRDRFPLDQMVRTEFSPGQSCANIILIVIT